MIIYRARPAWRSQWLTLGLILILGLLYLTVVPTLLSDQASAMIHLALIIAGVCLLGLLLPVLYRHYAWRYTIDEEQIESRYGIVTRDLSSMRIEYLHQIRVRRSLFQRLWGIGDIRFIGPGGNEIEFKGIAQPLQLKARAQALLDEFSSHPAAIATPIRRAS